MPRSRHRVSRRDSNGARRETRKQRKLTFHPVAFTLVALVFRCSRGYEARLSVLVYPAPCLESSHKSMSILCHINWQRCIQNVRPCANHYYREGDGHSDCFCYQYSYSRYEHPDRSSQSVSTGFPGTLSWGLPREFSSAHRSDGGTRAGSAARIYRFALCRCTVCSHSRWLLLGLQILASTRHGERSKLSYSREFVNSPINQMRQADVFRYEQFRQGRKGQR
jgi:hypothetical protein